jgi:O-acetyl-ADP-ribose deacetylase (regulator of RNase III)
MFAGVGCVDLQIAQARAPECRREVDPIKGRMQMQANTASITALYL